MLYLLLLLVKLPFVLYRVAAALLGNVTGALGVFAGELASGLWSALLFAVVLLAVCGFLFRALRRREATVVRSP